jgi:hypothetical protein
LLLSGAAKRHAKLFILNFVLRSLIPGRDASARIGGSRSTVSPATGVPSPRRKIEDSTNRTTFVATFDGRPGSIASPLIMHIE